MRNGGCKYYDSCYFTEISALFPHSKHCHVELHDAGYKTIKRKDSVARQLAFLAKVTLCPEAVGQYFQDRWQERVRRPTCQGEADKLSRRLKIYAEEMWCSRRNLDWNIKICDQEK